MKEQEITKIHSTLIFKSSIEVLEIKNRVMEIQNAIKEFNNGLIS